MDLTATVSVHEPTEWNWLIKLYLFLLVLLLPLDWFAPTGLLLREGGAKPAIPLMVLASLLLVIAHRHRFLFDLPPLTSRILCIFGAIFVCGFTAFMLNLLFGWSRFGISKDPGIQFGTQAILFLLMPIIIVAHAELFEERRWTAYLLDVLPWAAAIHLTVPIAEIAGILRYDRFPLTLFRVGQIEGSMRVAGLFSEPSYFGAMAAIFGLPLLLIRPARYAKLRTVLALSLFAMAIYTGGKTVVPVTLCGLLGFWWFRRIRILTPLRVGALLAVLAITVVVVIQTSVFNVQDNLSSAMRFGSTITSLNAALVGYGLTGTGFGQFHFMFRQQFIPSFLFYSQEALDQMSSVAEHRSSTYNLFARYLIETGIIGLFLFIAFLRSILKAARNDQTSEALFGILLITVSIGFLMTQDPYCYPPIMLGAALVLGGHHAAPLPL